MTRANKLMYPQGTKNRSDVYQFESDSGIKVKRLLKN